ncbi:ARM repeat-containing protein [Marasmius fiardii PR-910]|nr:ARM repeat-containing protein [Marasmius fiardii PR-910]
MADVSFLPALSQSDIDRAAQLILQAYGSSNAGQDVQRIQQELLDIQRLPEAWGLVIPFLNHEDQNIQFFGAHTAQVKIARDWASFPQEHVEALRDLLIQLTAHSVAVRKKKIVLRKLFVSLTSLALKLVPQHPTRWPDWILGCVTSMSGRGAATDNILDFLAIVAEEVSSADLIGSSKARMQQSLLDATTMVIQAIKTSIDGPLDSASHNNVLAALKCLQAWLSHLPSSDLTPLFPSIISLLQPDADVFVGASDTLQEVMAKSALADGSGSRILTEPLLVWLDSCGSRVVNNSLQSGVIDEVSQSLCKLITALGDHSTSYIAAHMASPASVSLLPSAGSTLLRESQNKTKGQLSQVFLKLLLAYTGFPGYYGVDEDVSEMTLGFWYMLQEALWNNDFYIEEGGEPSLADQQSAVDQTTVAKELYVEVVKVLREKIKYPGPGNGWSKDQFEKFQVYRRDVGDILINAYYVIRDDMMGFFISEVANDLSAVQVGQKEWEDVEATLHCILSIQEALDYEKIPHLPRLFSSEILGRLPTTGHVRVRRTTLSLLGTYASWFASNPEQPTVPTKEELLTTAVSYAVQALPDSLLSLQAASALRNLCDANRKLLAPRIGAFAELHAGLARVPDSEKATVMESIASVIEALPPTDAIPTIEVIVNPIVQSLVEALRSPTPLEAREQIVLQLETLSGIAKGLTDSSSGDTLLDDDPELDVPREVLKAAREDERTVRLRQNILDAIRACVEIFGHDAGIAQVVNELVKSITSLPADMTLISLPASPLLEIVCFALQRQVTASWLSVAGILITQLSPPPPMPLSDKKKEEMRAKERAAQEEQTKAVVAGVLPVILSTSLAILGSLGGMENNPDIVQEFFNCLDRVAQNMPGNLYFLPTGGLDALMRCAIRALTLQERYSLVAACSFLSTFIHRSFVHESLAPYRTPLVNTHGRAITEAVVSGLAGQAPRSATTNLIEMLSTLLTRCLSECRVWLHDVLFNENFVTSKATKEDKERFMKAILGSRTLKRTREAAQQFTLVARGLEGTSFGYVSTSS